MAQSSGGALLLILAGAGAALGALMIGAQGYKMGYNDARNWQRSLIDKPNSTRCGDSSTKEKEP